MFLIFLEFRWFNKENLIESSIFSHFQKIIKLIYNKKALYKKISNITEFI